MTCSAKLLVLVVLFSIYARVYGTTLRPVCNLNLLATFLSKTKCFHLFFLITTELLALTHPPPPPALSRHLYIETSALIHKLTLIKTLSNVHHHHHHLSSAASSISTCLFFAISFFCSFVRSFVSSSKMTVKIAGKWTPAVISCHVMSSTYILLNLTTRGASGFWFFSLFSFFLNI